jgi:DNA-binding response OmpR family regulator
MFPASNLLLMEDDPEISSLYAQLLKYRGHKVKLAHTAEQCLKIYGKRLDRAQMRGKSLRHAQPYDAVILDYKMPDRNGIEVAKEIQAINSHQRIIFLSAFVNEWFDSIKELKSPVEFLHKPVSNKKLIDTIELTEVFEQLERLNIDTEAFKQARISHEVLREIIVIVKKNRSMKKG